MLCEQIKAFHRQRCFMMEQRKRSDLALGAFLRTQLGWLRSLPEKERKAIEKQATDLIKSPSGEWEALIRVTLAARQPFANEEEKALKKMEDLARQLPVWWTFGEDIRGFGPASLAVIIGEAGDLSNYPDHSKLWKRMGVAVCGDVRQGGLPKNAPAEAWIKHGYSPKRRSRLWNIGDALIKNNQDGEYRTAYLTRKAYELERDPGMTPMKAHRRAQRYMEKRLLKKLWQAWRASLCVPEKAMHAMPAKKITGDEARALLAGLDL